jgi:hypothetical protein
MAQTEEARMEQIRLEIAGSTWLGRLTDLLLIFRRPVPVPVRTRRF